MPVAGIQYSSQEAMFSQTISLAEGEELTDEMLDKLEKKTEVELNHLLTGEARWICEGVFSTKKSPEQMKLRRDVLTKEEVTKEGEQL